MEKKLKQEWTDVNNQSITNLRLQVSRDRQMQHVPGCRYTVLELKHLFEVALEDLEKHINGGLNLGSVFAKSVERLGVVVARVEDDVDEDPFFTLGQMLGAARLIAHAMRSALDLNHKLVKQHERGQLLDIVALFEAVKEG